MRIAVVSLKVNANYGGLLQAWAMQQVLRRMGHEPV
ncbi:MAG: polysaccharide pyruvyl transferase family protein, partial [Muribaculaceae bacterium]|nr:polysaccharide pyruvyl transferase family protein [Muribaculaceae bacterium]